VARVRVAEVERQGREVGLAGEQPVQSEAKPQAVAIPAKPQVEARLKLRQRWNGE
jgi:hypothetical protein